MTNKEAKTVLNGMLISKTYEYEAQNRVIKNDLRGS